MPPLIICEGYQLRRAGARKGRYAIVRRVAAVYDSDTRAVQYVVELSRARLVTYPVYVRPVQLGLFGGSDV